MKKLIYAPLMSLLIMGAAQAHNRWILPSHFNVSAESDAWVMLDVTASNETFNVDKPMGAEKVKVIAPDGKQVFQGASFRGHRKSVVDVHLTQSGTYQFLLTSEPFYMTYYDDSGEGKRFAADKQQRHELLPKGASQVKTAAYSSKVMSYATLNEPSEQFVLSQKGLELVPVTHPSDIAEKEPVKFKFLLDGQPQAGVKIVVIKDGVRYRNEPNPLTTQTDSKGVTEFTLNEAGRYLLMASYDDTQGDSRADSYHEKLFLTFEAVLN